MNHRFIILDGEIQARLRRWGVGIGFLTRSWLTADRMLQLGRYVQLMREPMMTDSSLIIYMRMEPSMFVEILNRVGPDSKRVTPSKAFEPDVKLARTKRA